MEYASHQTSLKPLLCMVILTLFTSWLPAQNVNDDDIRVSTELSRSSVYVGDELSYQIVVRGSTNPMPPEIEFPDLVRSQFHGRTSQSFTTQRIINGVRRSVTERSFIFQYTLTALGEGQIQIPAPTVVVGSKTYTGEPSTFQALLPSRSDDDDMEILLDRTDIYLNETVEVECVWWIADQTSEFNFSASTFPESFVIRPVEQRGSGQYQVDFILNGQSMSGTVETGSHKGKQMSRFSFRISITPSELGDFELGPLRAIFTRHSGTGNRFRAFAESEPVSVRVLRVPDEGQPPNYTGAIGQFQVFSRASNSRVNVGDPIQLTLRIRGEEPMLGANTPPDLHQSPDFLDRFKIDSGGWREITPRNQGTRLFETTIRALDENVTRIPPIKLPSFNPAIGSYKVYQSDPIPIDVTAVKEITLADAIVRGSENTPAIPTRQTVDKIELTNAAPGLWAHGSASEIESQDGFNLAVILKDPAWQTLLVTPPLVYFASLGLAGFIRNRDQSLLVLRNAYRSAKHKHGDEALRTYLSEVLDIDFGAVSAMDAYQLPVDEELRHECYRVLIKYEYFAAQHDQIDTRDLLQRVHRQSMTRRRGVVT